MLLHSLPLPARPPHRCVGHVRHRGRTLLVSRQIDLISRTLSSSFTAVSAVFRIQVVTRSREGGGCCNRGREMDGQSDSISSRCKFCRHLFGYCVGYGFLTGWIFWRDRHASPSRRCEPFNTRNVSEVMFDFQREFSFAVCKLGSRLDDLSNKNYCLHFLGELELFSSQAILPCPRPARLRTF